MKLQDRTVRVVTYESRSIDTSKKLDWKTLSERSKEQQVKYISKALYVQMP